MDVPCEVTLLLKQVDNGFLSPFDHIPPYITRMPTGQHHYQNTVLIPMATPQGKYVFIRNYRCFINTLNVATTSVTSNEFMVMGRAKNQLELIKEGNEISKVNTKKLDRIQNEMKKK
jgi:hypothetical protein